MGIFCRFGLADDSRPVAVPVWPNVVWTRLVPELISTGKLTIPVLSVSGEASFGEAQKSFVEAFATNVSRHVTVADSGHFVAEEQPGALIAELRTFLAT